MVKKAKKPKVRDRKKPVKSVSTKMTPRTELFVLEFLKDLNAGNAAKRAGFSENGARQAGHRLLTNVDVQAAIAEAMEKRAKSIETDATWLLKRLREEADADILECFDEKTNTIRPMSDWPLVWRQGLMAQLEITTLFGADENGPKSIGTTTKIKPADRHQKLMAIGKHTNIGAFAKALVKKAEDDGPNQFLQEVYGNSIRPGGAGGGNVH
ncbi:terminase small subunit [Mesorhizobium huakuii]|uniref:Terminase small subunit n=1 Tax=Mesorhizobium huakuii TaxID=28104 RepID=A0A7G6T0T8_9HYPH|nr:terminase small subunit [Mesorhizobium huakuii]QND60370.1 terminase small subunit [Mesorhizobium huakuii]